MFYEIVNFRRPTDFIARPKIFQRVKIWLLSTLVKPNCYLEAVIYFRNHKIFLDIKKGEKKKKKVRLFERVNNLATVSR